MDIYHKAKFWGENFVQYQHSQGDYDVVHTVPSHTTRIKQDISAQFDTVLINDETGDTIGVKG